MCFKFQYYKDPGILTDAIKLISVRINPKSLLVPSAKINQIDPVNTEYIFTQSHNFITPPSEVLLFFFKQHNDDYNFITLFLEKLLCAGFSNFTMLYFKKMIENIPYLKKELYSFYFKSPNIPDSDFEKTLRKTSFPPDSIKYHLLNFHIDPIIYIKSLWLCLKSYVATIEKMYLSKYKNYEPEQNSILTFISISPYSNQVDAFKSKPLLYSLCPVTRDYAYIHSSTIENWFIIGPKFSDSLNLYMNNSATLDLPTIFAALGDPIRFKIVNYLQANPNTSTKTITKALSLPSTSAHHHFEKLRKAQILSFHKQKDGIMYSINYQLFVELSHILKLYTQEGDKHETLETSDGNLFN